MDCSKYTCANCSNWKADDLTARDNAAKCILWHKTTIGWETCDEHPKKMLARLDEPMK